MCLRLSYAEALLWKGRATKLIADAKAKAAEIDCNPLFSSNSRLSALVSEVDGIKKRHGLLIEEALIWAINKVPGWQASKERITVAGGKAHLDCLAFNTALGKLYVFECKRGHGSFDSDKVRAIDQRLDKVTSAMPTHAAAKGWQPKSIDTFILSFYGKTWKSKYPIHDKNSIAALFGPCVQRFTTDYMTYVEASSANAYASELKTDIAPVTSGTIFDKVDAAREKPWPDLLFSGDVMFIEAETPM